MSLLLWGLGCVLGWRKQLMEKPWSRTEQILERTWRQHGWPEPRERSRRDQKGPEHEGPCDQWRDFNLTLRAMRRPLVSSKQGTRQGQISFHSYPNSLLIHSFNKYLLGKSMKRCLASLVITGMRIKPQRHTITYPQERLKWKAKFEPKWETTETLTLCWW